MITVMKPFKTRTRRFKAGDAVTPSDADKATMDRLLARGFVSEETDEAKSENQRENSGKSKRKG